MPEGTRCSRGAGSGSVSTKRVTGGSGSVGGAGVGAAATGFGAGSGGGGPGSGTGSGFGGSGGASTSSSHVGTCSTVDSCGSSSGAAACSACRCAASVARNSSASGPSRMLARFRAIEHLLRQLTVRLGGGSGGVVLQHGRALHRCLRVADRLADPGLVDEVAEVLLEDLEGLARVQRPAVVHRRQDPLDPDVRVQVL